MQMINQTFNLTTDPWIKVIETDSGKERLVSLIDLFRNAQNYQQLAGEMRSQDLAILRFLLAILTTVYSRFDAEDEPYDWLTIDKNTMKVSQVVDDVDQHELLDTWSKLYKSGHFTESVTEYLKVYRNRFCMFGEHPFYQVTESEFNQAVPAEKRIANGKRPGEVGIKQMNRQISESGNKLTVFSPKSKQVKNTIKIDELVRWLITYQNFTGVTDKTKVKSSKKFSNSAGWLYKLNPVFAQGKTLFQTLMLNLILVQDVQDDSNYQPQKPVWEYNDVSSYLAELNKQLVPQNLAELYTSWSRLLCIFWDQEQPIVFSAGIPTFDNANAFIESMTTWHFNKKTNQVKPATRRFDSLGTAMWRNFGQYVKLQNFDDDPNYEPGIVTWLHLLDDKTNIPLNSQITLASTTLVSDGNGNSQMPIAEVYDDMSINANVLFDKNNSNFWPQRIEDTIEATEKVGNMYRSFAKKIAAIRGYDKNIASKFADRMSGKFYESLNQPFKLWLSQLTNHDDRDQEIKIWYAQLARLVYIASDNMLQSSSSRDIRGIIRKDKNGNIILDNIFTITNNLRYKTRKTLNLQ
jgi:CRISPR system Cascade subunit CasA